MNAIKLFYLIIYHVLFNGLPWYFKFLGCNKIRNFLFSKITNSGKNVSIGRNSDIMDITKLLKIKDNVSIGDNFRFIGYSEPAIIGNNVVLGFDCVLITTQHNYGDRGKNIKDQGYRDAKIIIEDDVFFGGRVYVMPGVRIGKGTYVGSGSIISKSIPPYSIAWGVPARIVKIR